MGSTHPLTPLTARPLRARTRRGPGTERRHMTRVFHCSTCGQAGHTARNHHNQRPKNGRRGNSKARNLRNHYRLEWDTYLAWLASGCGICGIDLSGRTPDVDHDHACEHPGKGRYSCRACVRGLLCRSCNLRVGAFERGLNADEDIAAYLSPQGHPVAAFQQASLFDAAVATGA